MTLDQFATRMEAASVKLVPALEVSLPVYGEVVKEAAKEMIGHEHPEWPPLTPSYIAAKAAAGFPVPAPLLRTGEMRESIVFDVLGMTLVVGSPDKLAVFHELGTSRMPPRPFLSPSMVKTLPVAAKLIGKAANMAVTGRVFTMSAADVERE